jgi:hypothetical protein
MLLGILIVNKRTEMKYDKVDTCCQNLNVVDIISGSSYIIKYENKNNIYLQNMRNFSLNEKLTMI